MRILAIVLGAVLLLVVAVGVAAPLVLEGVANDVLATIPDYEARVDDADVSLFGGFAALDGLSVARPGLDSPFVAADRVEVRPVLGALLRGDRIADVTVDGLAIHYVLGVDEARSQLAIDPEWLRRQVERFPATLDGLTVRGGTFHYRDDAASPDVHLVIGDLEVDGANLANLERSEEPLFGRIEVRGRLEGGGRVTAHVRVDPYAEEPRFVVDARIAQVPLAAMNDALRAYGDFDVSSGTFSVTSRVVAEHGAYSGVATPELEDLVVVGRGEARAEKQPALRRVWEALVGTAKDAAEVVTRGQDDEIETVVRFSGRFDEDPALVEILEVLPAAWFGSLERAVRAGSAAVEEAARGATEAGQAAERERGDRRRREKRR